MQANLRPGAAAMLFWLLLCVTSEPCRAGETDVATTSMAMREQTGAQKSQPHEVKVDNAEGGTVALSQFCGRVTVLVAAGSPGSIEAATALLQDVIVASAARKNGTNRNNGNNVAYLIDANLRVPGFMHGQIRGRVKSVIKAKRDALQAALKQARLTYEPSHAPTFLLDWNGTVVREYSLSGDLNSGYQVIILDREGRPTFQTTQPIPQKGAKAPVETILQAIDAAVAPGGGA